MWDGNVVAVYIARDKCAPMERVEAAYARCGVGLDGDRYASRTGTYAKKWRPGRELTLIEEEALQALVRDQKIELATGASRRNVIVRGVPLNHLVGAEFQVGEVRLRGTELCEPCGHLESLTQTGAREALLHRGGLRAEILSEGWIRDGAPVRPCDAGARGA